MRWTFTKRVWLLLAAGLALAGVFWLAVSTEHDVLAFSVPVLVALFLMLLIHHGYLALRELRWRRRQTVESDALADLAIPADVPKPKTFAGVKDIDDAQHRALRPVADAQGIYFARGIRISLLPAVAVLFVAIQMTFPQHTALASGMIGAEVVVLLATVLLVWSDPEPVRDWLFGRARAELFRREQYLRLACVGPYLGLDEKAAARQTEQRLAILKNADLNQLRSQISMGDEQHWADAVWTRGGSGNITPDLGERMRSFLYYRVDKQIMWFSLGIKANEDAEKQGSRMVKTVLILATLFAVAQTVLISQQPSPGVGASAVSLLSLVAPAACAFLLGLQDLFAYQRLALSYADTGRALNRYRTALAELIDQYEQDPADADAVAKRFQSLVLRLENELAQELLRWMLLIRRSEFDAAL